MGGIKALDFCFQYFRAKQVLLFSRLPSATLRFARNEISIFIFPSLLIRLVHEDKKSSETACVALSRLAESYKNDRIKLAELARPEVLANLQQILVTNPPNVSSNTFVTVLHILVLMSSNGSDVGLLLLEENIGSTMRQLLVGTGKVDLAKEEFDLVQRNPQELYEITSLISELIPPLPADGIFAVDALLAKPGAYVRDPVIWQWQDDRGVWHTYGFNDCR